MVLTVLSGSFNNDPNRLSSEPEINIPVDENVLSVV